MKRKNTLNAGVVAFSLLTIAGIAPMASAISQADAVSIDDTQDAKAVEIIEASIEALGGSDVLTEAKYMKQTGTITIPSAGLSGTLESYAKSPDSFLLVMTLPGFGEQRTGMNDGVAWSSDVMSGPRLLSDEETESLKDEADVTSQLQFRDQYPTIEFVGEVDFDGSKASKIKLIDDDGNESIKYYSVETKLPLGVEQTAPSQMGPIKTVTIMRDYKEIGGMKVPFTIVQKLGPQEVKMEIKETSFDKFDESVFELPAAVKALVEAQKKDD